MKNYLKASTSENVLKKYLMYLSCHWFMNIVIGYTGTIMVPFHNWRTFKCIYLYIHSGIFSMSCINNSLIRALWFHIQTYPVHMVTNNTYFGTSNWTNNNINFYSLKSCYMQTNISFETTTWRSKWNVFVQTVWLTLSRSVR